MPKSVYNSSTPIKPNFDPVSKNSSTSANCTMNYEKIYPGIYLTSVKGLCAPDDLKIYGFTHIIYIDQHIIAQNRMSVVPHIDANGQNDDDNATGKTNHDNVIKSAETSVTASITIRHTSSSSVTCVPSSSSSMMDRSPHSSKSTESISVCSTSMSLSFNHEMRIDDEPPMKLYASNENLFGHSDFETLDLNFGESSYFTANVLPNCYKAVAFIEKALKNNGAVLVIDCIGEHQKCMVLVIGFLMYKYNKNFLYVYDSHFLFRNNFSQSFLLFIYLICAFVLFFFYYSQDRLSIDKTFASKYRIR